MSTCYLVKEKTESVDRKVDSLRTSGLHKVSKVNAAEIKKQIWKNELKKIVFESKREFSILRNEKEAYLHGRR